MIVKHYKGGTYTVLFEAWTIDQQYGVQLFKAFDSTNCADRDKLMIAASVFDGHPQIYGTKPFRNVKMVVYVSHTTGGIFCRDKAEFDEMVMWPDGVVRPRFAFDREYERPVKPALSGISSQEIAKRIDKAWMDKQTGGT